MAQENTSGVEEKYTELRMEEEMKTQESYTELTPIKETKIQV